MMQHVYELNDASVNGESSGLANPDKTATESEESEEEIDVGMFGESKGLADVVLIVEGTRIPVVKNVLSLASPVFQAMFHGDFAEKEQTEIPLPEKELKSFFLFLQSLYPLQKERVTDDTVVSILPLAVEYQVDNLTKKCEECLVKSIRWQIRSTDSISCTESCKFLKVAEDFHLVDLRLLCIRWIASFTLKERMSAFQRHAISEESKTKISNRAFIMHQKIEHDLCLLPKHISLAAWFKQGSDTLEQSVPKLRLAYKTFGRSSLEYKLQIGKLNGFFTDHAEHDKKVNKLYLPEDVKEDLLTEFVRETL